MKWKVWRKSPRVFKQLELIYLACSSKFTWRQMSRCGLILNSIDLNNESVDSRLLLLMKTVPLWVFSIAKLQSFSHVYDVKILHRMLNYFLLANKELTCPLSVHALKLNSDSEYSNKLFKNIISLGDDLILAVRRQYIVRITPNIAFHGYSFLLIFRVRLRLQLCAT